MAPRNPPGFGYRGPIYYVDNTTYDYYDDNTPETRTVPTYIIGKTLIRTGQQPIELVNKGYLTDNEAKKYVWESSLPSPYKILMPGDVEYGGNPDTLLVFVNKNGVITNTFYDNP